MLTVHLRVNDSATGQPTPVRIRITGPDGRTFAPLGRNAEFPTGRNEAVGGHVKIGAERWCYIDGACEAPLPAGVPLRIQATKGPEHLPLDETVTLGPGQMALRFAIARALDWRARGYNPGDPRCHFLSPHAGLLEAMAEDLDLAAALAAPISMLAMDGNSYSTVPDLLAFSGQGAALAAPPRHSFVVGTLNAHPVLGKVGLLHSHRVVYPLTFGGFDESDDWAVFDWCAQCHRKGGLTTWVDAFEPAGGVMGGEALAAAILGQIDAIEIDAGSRSIPLTPWLYRLWDVGTRLALVGASGKESNRTALGAMRTYAHVPGEFNLASWFEAIRSGRTFAASGPLLDLQVNGARPGETVACVEPATVVARAESLTQFGPLEVLSGGEVIASATPAFHPETRCWSAVIEHAFSPTTSGWLAARCIGADSFAHTSSIHLRVDGNPIRKRPEAALALAKLLRQTREWAETQGRYASDKRRQQLLARCDEAVGALERE
jgi:hypothetical protein